MKISGIRQASCDRSTDLASYERLEKVVAGAMVESCLNILKVLESADEDDRDLYSHLPHLLQDLDTAQMRHRDIQQGDIRAQCKYAIERAASIGELADDLDSH